MSVLNSFSNPPNPLLETLPSFILNCEYEKVLPELLPEGERLWAYETFKKYGGEKSFSLWVEMVQVAGEETAFNNILKSYEEIYGVNKLTAEFKQVMYTALKHHFELTVTT